MVMQKLSNAQQLIYDFVLSFQEKHGYPPSVREICQAVGLRSTSTVHGHLARLEKKGYLRRDSTKPRAIEITALQQKKSRSITLPIVGNVTAGVPILAQEEIRGYYSLPRELARGEDSFILEICGDSMIDAGIFNRDQIIISPEAQVRNGDIIVAMIFDERTNDHTATCKRYFKENGHIRLQPENSRMEPIIVDQVEIVGKVIGLMRSYH